MCCLVLLCYIILVMYLLSCLSVLPCHVQIHNVCLLRSMGIVLTKASFRRQSYQSLKWQKRRVPHVTKARADLEYGSHRDSPKGCQRLALHPRALALDPGLCPEDNGRRGPQEASPGPRTHCKSSNGTLLVRLLYHVMPAVFIVS